MLRCYLPLIALLMGLAASAQAQLTFHQTSPPPQASAAAASLSASQSRYYALAAQTSQSAAAASAASAAASAAVVGSGGTALTTAQVNIVSLQNITQSTMGYVVALQNASAAQQTTIAGINTSIAGINTSVSGLSTSVSGLTTSVSGLTSSVSGLTTSVTAAQGSITSLQSNVTSLQSAVAGLAAGGPSSAPPGYSNAVTLGATGDNSTVNDTAFASIFASGAPVYLPEGIFVTHTPVTPTAPAGQGSFPPGLVLQGNRPNVGGYAASGGTAIYQTGTNQDSIIYFGGSYPFRSSQIANIKLSGNTDGTTAYGIHTDNSSSNGLETDGLRIGGVDKAIGYTNSQDGENSDFNHTTVSSVREVYFNSSGQSYTHNLRGVYGQLLDGCTAFEIGSAGNSGFQLNVYDVDLTMRTTGGNTSPSTFLKLNGSNGTINFHGGRAETCDTLIKFNDYSSSIKGQVVLDGIEFTYAGANAPLIVDTGSTNNQQYDILIENCAIDAPPSSTPAPIAFTLPSGMKSRIVFKNCLFRGFGVNSAALATGTDGQYGGLFFKDCFRDTPTNTLMVAVN